MERTCGLFILHLNEGDNTSNLCTIIKSKVGKSKREDHIKLLESELEIEEHHMRESNEKIKVFVDDYNWELSIVRKILKALDKDVSIVRFDTPESYRNSLFFKLEMHQREIWSTVLKVDSANGKIHDLEYKLEQVRKQRDRSDFVLRRAMRKLVENGITDEEMKAIYKNE